MEIRCCSRARTESQSEGLTVGAAWSDPGTKQVMTLQAVSESLWTADTIGLPPSQGADNRPGASPQACTGARQPSAPDPAAPAVRIDDSGIMSRCPTELIPTTEWSPEFSVSRVASFFVTAHLSVTGTQTHGTCPEDMSKTTSSHHRRSPASSGKSSASESRNQRPNHLLTCGGLIFEWRFGCSTNGLVNLRSVSLMSTTLLPGSTRKRHLDWNSPTLDFLRSSGRPFSRLPSPPPFPRSGCRRPTSPGGSGRPMPWYVFAWPFEFPGGLEIPARLTGARPSYRGQAQRDGLLLEQLRLRLPVWTVDTRIRVSSMELITNVMWLDELTPQDWALSVRR